MHDCFEKFPEKNRDFQFNNDIDSDVANKTQPSVSNLNRIRIHQLVVVVLNQHFFLLFVLKMILLYSIVIYLLLLKK